MSKRFWSKVDRSGGPDSCWPWTGDKDPGGYGRFCLSASRKGRVKIAAHRMAHQLHHGVTLAEGVRVCHDCPGGDNPACCNPAHLFTGTQGDNVRDMIRKGRGRMSESAKLSRDQVSQARRRYAGGGITQARLAEELEVHESTVWAFLNGKTFRDE